jgi:hypothetical protein
VGANQELPDEARAGLTIELIDLGCLRVREVVSVFDLVY